MRDMIASEWDTERYTHLNVLPHFHAGAAAGADGIQHSVLQTAAKECCKAA